LGSNERGGVAFDYLDG